MAELEAAAGADSNDALEHYHLALAYWNEKRWEDSERALREATTVDPRLAEAHLGLGLLCFARRPELAKEMAEGRVPAEWMPVLEASRRSYRRAFLIDPLVDLRAVGAVATSEDGEDEALGVLGAAAYEDTHAHLHNAVFFLRMRGEEVNPALLWVHGLAAAHIGRNDEAIKEFERLLETTRKHEQTGPASHLPLQSNEYRYVLAYLNHRAGKTDRAIRLYKEALRHDLGLYMAHTRLAEIYEGRRMWRAAIAERRRAIQVMPEDASLHFDLGVTLSKGRRPEEAEIELRRALEANPRHAMSAYFLGVVQQEMGKTADARASFERFLELAPSRYAPQIADAKNRIATLR